LRPRLTLLVSFLALAAGGCTMPVATAPGTIVSRDGTVLSEAELVAAVMRAQIVVIGEVHDNPVHHARQAELVRAIRPGGIAFEMVPSDSEEGIQVFLAEGGARGAIGPAIGWDRMGWPDWAMYRPVFEAAPDAYVAGGGVAGPSLRAAIRDGAAGAFGIGANRFGLDQSLDPATRTEIEDEMIAAHCDKLPRKAAVGMVEAQRLRDARFAEAAWRAYAAADGWPAVLITGNGHARTDRGVPAYLRLVLPDVSVLSVGQIEVGEGEDPVAAARGLPFDFVWTAPPAERPDPCAGFK